MVLTVNVNRLIHCRLAGGFVTLVSMGENEFQAWVKDLVTKHFGGRFQLFADQVGVTFSALSRSVKKGSTSVETLLRLAIVTGEPPATVFRIAGKPVIHDLITQLYGPASTLALSERAKKVALAFDALDEDPAKKFYLESLQGLTERQRARNGGPSIAKKTAAHGRSSTHGNQSRQE